MKKPIEETEPTELTKRLATLEEELIELKAKRENVYKQDSKFEIALKISKIYHELSEIRHQQALNYLGALSENSLKKLRRKRLNRPPAKQQLQVELPILGRKAPENRRSAYAIKPLEKGRRRAYREGISARLFAKRAQQKGKEGRT